MAKPTCVGLRPTTRVRYSANVVINAPLPKVLTRVAPAMIRRFGSTGTPLTVSGLGASSTEWSTSLPVVTIVPSQTILTSR